MVKNVGELSSAVASMKLEEQMGEHEGDGQLVHDVGSDEEKAAFARMLEAHKDRIAGTGADEFWQLACLRARKYDIDRAVELLEKYMAWREQFEVDKVTPANDPEFRAHVEAGVVRCAGTTDKLGRYVLFVDISRHNPSRWPAQQVVRTVHFVVVGLLRAHPEAQARGVVMVNDLTKVGLSNLDAKVPRELFNALNSRFPLRFGGAYLVDAPLFFRVLFPLIKVFMKKKFQERLRLVKTHEDLREFVEQDKLLPEVGGQLVYDHHAEVQRLVGELDK